MTATKNHPTDLVGRQREVEQVRVCLRAGRNVLLEGPVGSGKTWLALAVSQEMERPIFRIDGDQRFTEQKLVGGFDPPTVIQKGYSQESFLPGPLFNAMTLGGVLFINELNRLPEGVQNVLLPAIDEGLLSIPRMGEIRAKSGFSVIATQNPKEFVATSHLSEAILDRFELVVVDYQPENDELEIVFRKMKQRLPGLKETDILTRVAVRLVRQTRNHPRIRRGASVRAALSLSEIAGNFVLSGRPVFEAFVDAALISLPTRIEVEHELGTESRPYEETEALVRDLARDAFQGVMSGAGVKKKN